MEIKNMIKRIVIKLFKLHDIADLLLKSKQKQKRLDDDYWKDVLKENIDRLNREHELELQEKDAQISMLNQHIESYKQREKEIDKKEFQAKSQIKQNSFVMRSASDFMKEFAESINIIYGRMDKLKETVDKQKKAIEEKV